MPLVSIIILTYNRATYLLEALDSVFAQSYTNFEILILDDGSTDDTRIKVERLNYTKIQYFFFPHSGNIMRLRNEGIKRTKGDYIAFLDSDDLWLPTKLARQVSLLEQDSSLAMTFSNVEEFNQKAFLRKGIYHKTASNLFLSVLSGESPIYPSSVLIRKKIIDELGFFDEASKTGETHYFLKLIRQFPIHQDFIILTKIRKHPTNITHSLEEQAYEEMLNSIRFFWKKNALSNKDLKNLNSLYYYRFASLLLEKKQYRKAFHVWHKGFKTNLFKVKWSKFLFKLFLATLKAKSKATTKRLLRWTCSNYLEKRRFEKTRSFYAQFLKKGDLCFDIGANEGLKTNIFLSLGANVIAVEPQHDCCVKIKEQFPVHPNLRIIEKAIGSAAGEMEMFISTYDKISSLSTQFVHHYESFGELKWPDKRVVKVTTLDMLIEEYGLPQFCKIDVEGFEMEVFRGLTHVLPNLSFEFNKPFKSNAVHCIDWLTQQHHYVFNYAIYENPHLELGDWISGEEMKIVLLNMDEKILTGDVYAKLNIV